MTSTIDNQQVTLEIGGMTCSSCAMRIEKKLNKLDGVTATVNYALEQAAVTAPEGVSVDELVAQVEAAGYTARLPKPAGVATAHAGIEAEEHDETAPLQNRLLTSLALTIPVVALAMIPALQFENWQWLSLTLAMPVAVWGALPFHRAAWVNLRHATPTMDTLISVGVIAAIGWSLWALFLGEAGTPGMKMSFSLDVERGAGTHEIYLEVATAVTVFILAGRYYEAKAKRRGGGCAPGSPRARRQGRRDPPRRRRTADSGRTARRRRAVRRPPG